MSENQKTAAVIGAGMAGLGAALSLLKRGWKVKLYEKSRGVGGRVATRRIDGCIFDHGAQILKPSGSSLEKLILQELPREGLVEVNLPIVPFSRVGARLPIDPARGSEKKYCYSDGMTALPKMLAQKCKELGGEIFLESPISRFEEGAEVVTLFGLDGSRIGEADALVITAPSPQAVALMEASEMRNRSAQVAQISALGSVAYRPCLSVLLGYDGFEGAEDAYALIAEDKDSPLLWLAFESVKSEKRASNGRTLLIAQFGGDFSKAHYDIEDAAIVERTLDLIRPLIVGRGGILAFSQVKRWRYSQPTGMVAFSEVNPAPSNVVVAGDALRPENGRVHQAYESGLEAAMALAGGGEERE